ncbi:TPA: RNA methyltransferase [Candidatus Ventrenecus avicola]|nr:RNA methyltransferase [Candidatus Ventrenecus avicola]
MKIESLQNKKVKEWASLKEKKNRDITNTFLIEGDHLLREALLRGVVLEVITTEEKNYDVPTFHVTNEIMKKITSQVTPPTVIAVTKKLEEKEINGPVLILDGIQDPGNLGTIIRSCVAFHMPNLLLSRDCVDLYNPKVIRSTEGMLFHVNIVRKDLEKILPELQKTHRVIGTDVKSGSSIEDLKSIDNIALVIGNEGNGLGVSKKYCDDFVYIPMNPLCESLNASVSASILLYEMGNDHE